MPMTTEQAKAAVTESILAGLQHMVGVLANGCANRADVDTDQAAKNFATGIAHLRHIEATAHRIIDDAFEERTGS